MLSTYRSLKLLEEKQSTALLRFVMATQRKLAAIVGKQCCAHPDHL